MLNLLIGALNKLHRNLLVARWRRRMDHLIAGGMKVGKNVVIEPGAILDQRTPFLIEIGDNVAIANGARILTHDATAYKWAGYYTRLGRVHIRDNVFIAENVIILPGVTIGPNALVAAGSVVNKDIPPNSCVAGVPARFYSKFEEMLDRQRQGIQTRPLFKHETLYYGDNKGAIASCREAVKDGDAYVQGFPGPYAFMLNPDASADPNRRPSPPSESGPAGPKIPQNS